MRRVLAVVLGSTSQFAPRVTLGAAGCSVHVVPVPHRAGAGGEGRGRHPGAGARARAREARLHAAFGWWQNVFVLNCNGAGCSMLAACLRKPRRMQILPALWDLG